MSETTIETYGALKIERGGWQAGNRVWVKITSGRAKRPYANYLFRTQAQADAISVPIFGRRNMRR